MLTARPSSKAPLSISLAIFTFGNRTFESASRICGRHSIKAKNAHVQVCFVMCCNVFLFINEVCFLFMGQKYKKRRYITSCSHSLIFSFEMVAYFLAVELFMTFRFLFYQMELNIFWNNYNGYNSISYFCIKIYVDEK